MSTATLERVNWPVDGLIEMPDVAVSTELVALSVICVIEKVFAPVPSVAVIGVAKVVSIPTVVA